MLRKHSSSVLVLAVGSIIILAADAWGQSLLQRRLNCRCTLDRRVSNGRVSPRFEREPYVRLVHAYSRVLSQNGFSLELLPSDRFRSIEVDPFVVASQWDLIETDLEQATRDVLGGGHEVDLQLHIFRPSEDEALYRVRLMAPPIAAVREALVTVLQLPDDVFVFVKPVYETKTLLLSQLKNEYLTDAGAINFATIGPAIEEFVRSTQFEDLMRQLYETAPPVQSTSRTSADGYEMITSWVVYKVTYSPRTIQHLWRLSLDIRRDAPSNLWKMNVVVRLARLSRGASKPRPYGVVGVDRPLNTAGVNTIPSVVFRMVPEMREYAPNVLPDSVPGGYVHLPSESEFARLAINVADKIAGSQGLLRRELPEGL